MAIIIMILRAHNLSPRNQFIHEYKILLLLSYNNKITKTKQKINIIYDQKSI
jgi:hypothetical protein